MSNRILEFSAPQYMDPFVARAFLESVMWPDGPVCPRCRIGDRVRRLALKINDAPRRDPNSLLKCYRCCYKFDVTVGSIFESSRVPLHLWLRAIAMVDDSSSPNPRELASSLEISRYAAKRMIELIAKHDNTIFTHDYRSAMPGRRNLLGASNGERASA